MPKKKPIDKRLEKLFEDVKPEQAPARPKAASQKRAPEMKASPPAEAAPRPETRTPVEITNHVYQSNSVMSLAFQAGQNSWATLQVMDETAQRRWSHDEQLLVKQVADQLSLALENAHLFQETQRRAQETAALAEVGREISATLDIETVLERIATYARSLLQAESSAVYLPDAQGMTWQAISAVGLDAEEIKSDPIQTGRGILGNVAITKVGQIVNDASNQPGTITVVGTDSRDFEHIMGVPILSLERVTGLMAVWRTGEGKDFIPTELDFLTSLAQQAAVAIENARLFNEVTTSQSQLSEALQIARLGYFEIDPSTQAVRLTDEFYSLLGTTVEKEGGYEFPLEHFLRKFVLEEDISTAFQTVQDAISGRQEGDETVSEVRFKAVDGRVIWVSSTYKPERDLQGNLIKVAGSSQDITDRKINELTRAAITQITESALTSRTMEELIASVHEAVATLLPARNFYVAMYDPTSNLITFPYHVDEYDNEWSPLKLSGKGLTSYVIRTGKPLRTTPEIFADMEASGEIVNDGTRSVDWLGVPLRSKQVVSGVVAVQTYDQRVRLTEHHLEILTVLAAQIASAIERFLAELEIQKFKLGIDHSDSAVFITDIGGVIQYVNPAFETIYGFSADEAIGNTPRILKSGLMPDEQYKHFWNTLLSGGTISGEITNKAKDGRLIPISGTNSPILDEAGKTMGFLAVHQDITERKRSEEILKRRNDYLAASSEIARLVTSTLDINTIFTRTVNLISERFGFYFAAIYSLEETGFNAILREGTGEAGEKMKAQKHSVVIGSNSVVGKVAERGEFDPA